MIENIDLVLIFFNWSHITKKNSWKREKKEKKEKKERKKLYILYKIYFLNTKAMYVLSDIKHFEQY